MLGKIVAKQLIATGTLLTTIDLQGAEISFKPGQFIFVTLPNIPYPDPKKGKRHFSLVNSPDQRGIVEFATRLRDESAYKKYLQELPLGSEVEVGPINGNLTLPEDLSKHYVFLAGGIGITPFISMLRYKIAHLPKEKITLVYSNRDQTTSAFLDEIQKMPEIDPNIKLVLTMTEDRDWMGETRIIDSGFIKDYFKEVTNFTFYIAGSPSMVQATDNALSEAGVNSTNIIKENFSGY